MFESFINWYPTIFSCVFGIKINFSEWFIAQSIISDQRMSPASFRKPRKQPESS
jgi:hypothetical protein